MKAWKVTFPDKSSRIVEADDFGDSVNMLAFWVDRAASDIVPSVGGDRELVIAFSLYNVESWEPMGEATKPETIQ